MTDEIEVEDKEPTLREQIVAARDEIAEKVEPAVETDAPVEDAPKISNRDEKGKFKSKETLTVADAPAVVVKEPPASWDAAAKAKFAALDPAMQDYVLKRETDTHKALTVHDEERNFGKTIKSVIAPYEAIIRSEGGTPEKAVGELMNTAYVLRQGTPQQKAEIVRNVMQQYGVDPRMVFAQAQAQTQAQPQQQSIDVNDITTKIKTQLQTEMEQARIQEAYNAFSSNPEFVHRDHPVVKAAMASLFQGPNPPNDYTEAYNKALSELSSITGSAPQVPAKPVVDVAAKKKAASSVTGSPGIAVANTGNPNLSLRDQIRASIREHI